MINIGINGFGRIGRMVCRAVFEKYINICNIVAINDPYLKIDDIIYLLQYDSIHGKLNKTIEKKDNYIIIDNKKIAIFHMTEPQNIPWNLVETLYVCESSGVFLDMESCKNHLLNGVKKVIISTPTIDTPLYIMGVNHHLYDKNDHIISNGSCTTNCLGPLIKLLNDTYGIVECFATTIHASTSSQKIVDMGGINKRRSYRSALCNIIPTPTKAIKAVLRIIPELEGKLTGLAFRIPIANVSVLDLSFRTINETKYEDIIELIKKSSSSIISYTEDDLVSSDFIHNSASCTVDINAGIQLNNNFIKLVAWYDNEWAYANRVIDLFIHIYKTDIEYAD